jgi:WD40 repeat protein
MNRALLNPFEAHKLPDNLEVYLESDRGKSTCMAFNRHGNVLAVGCSSGRVALWDFDTRTSDQTPAAFVGEEYRSEQQRKEKRAAPKASRLKGKESGKAKSHPGPTVCFDPSSGAEQLAVTSVAFPAPHTGHTILVSYARSPAPAGATHKPFRGAGFIRLCKTLAGTVITEIVLDVRITGIVPHPYRADILIAMPAEPALPMLIHLAPGRYHVPSPITTTPLGPDQAYILMRVGDSDRDLPQPSGDSPVDKDSSLWKTFGHTKPPACVPMTRPSVPVPAAVAAAQCATVNVLCVPHMSQDDARRLLRHKRISVPAPIEPPLLPNDANDDELNKQSSLQPPPSQGPYRRKHTPESYVVAFSQRGTHMLRGGPDGFVYVFELVDHAAALVNKFKIPGNSAIKSLTIFRNRLLVNSNDRTMRLFDVDPLLQRLPERLSSVANVDAGDLVARTIAAFTEAVNRLQCRCATFTSDGDFVLGGMAGNEHRIHIWRTSDGHLEGTLDGPTEGISDLLWHPVQPVIVSIGANYGGIYVWAKNFTENWSAFAPDFAELEANEEYIEAEDEFDAKDPGDDARIAAEREKIEENISVDVTTIDASSDEEGGDASSVGRYFYLPVNPVPDSRCSYPTGDAVAQVHRMRERKQMELAKEGRGPNVRRLLLKADGVGEDGIRFVAPANGIGSRRGSVGSKKKHLEDVGVTKKKRSKANNNGDEVDTRKRNRRDAPVKPVNAAASHTGIALSTSPLRSKHDDLPYSPQTQRHASAMNDNSSTMPSYGPPPDFAGPIPAVTSSRPPVVPVPGPNPGVPQQVIVDMQAQLEPEQ